MNDTNINEFCKNFGQSNNINGQRNFSRPKPNYECLCLRYNLIFKLLFIKKNIKMYFLNVFCNFNMRILKIK